MHYNSVNSTKSQNNLRGKSYSSNHRLLGFLQNTKAIPECDPDCPDTPAAVALFPLPCAQCAEGSLKIQNESRPTLVLNLHPVHFCYPSFYRRPISHSLIGAKSRINLHFHRFQAEKERERASPSRGNGFDDALASQKREIDMSPYIHGDSLAGVAQKSFKDAKFWDRCFNSVRSPTTMQRTLLDLPLPIMLST